MSAFLNLLSFLTPKPATSGSRANEAVRELLALTAAGGRGVSDNKVNSLVREPWVTLPYTKQ